MKAEELFIGALVRVSREGLSVKKGTIVEIRGIEADHKLVEKSIVGSALCRQMDDNQCAIWCEFLEPIKLTPEILEKNGFECRGAWCIPGEDLGLKQSGDSWRLLSFYGDYNAIPFCSIYFVHELQHALRLCGIENEITL